MSATPILDLEQAPPEPPKRSGLWGMFVIGLIGGLAAGIASKLAGLRFEWTGPGVSVWLLLPALWAAIAVHETGHLLAGKMVGMDGGGISVGPLVWMKSGKHWVVRWEAWRWAGGFFKPLTVNAPLWRCAWMTAGGPLASVALAAVCASAWLRYGDGAWRWLGTPSWISLFVAALSLVPFSTRATGSDAGRLLRLVRRRGQARLWMAQLAMQAEEAHGVRPREWSAGLFECVLATDASAREYPVCQWWAYYRRLDEGEKENAAEHLEKALAASARAGAAERHGLFLEAADACALIRKRAEAARKWRERACAVKKPESLHSVDAAIALCEGRYEEAAREYRAAQAYVARRRLDSGIIRYSKEERAELETECARRAAEAVCGNKPSPGCVHP